MITAIDTNVLVDFIGNDSEFGGPSRVALGRCRDEGAVVVCEVVWAETAAGVDSPAELRERLTRAGIGFDAMNVESAERAGVAWRRYRRRGGARTRLVADFLIGAHAQRQADRLLTRDRGFYRSYFPDLVLVDPLGSQ